MITFCATNTVVRKYGGAGADDDTGSDEEAEFRATGDGTAIGVAVDEVDEMSGFSTEKELLHHLKTKGAKELRKIHNQCRVVDKKDEYLDEILDHWMLNKQQTLEQQQLEAENTGKKVEDEAVEYSFNPADTQAHTFDAYFRYRVRHSNLRKYFGGFAGSLHLTSEETDTAVNAVVLLDALILTIPFSLLPSLNREYWDWLKEQFDACDDYPDGWDSKRWFNGWYAKLNTWTSSLIFCVCGAILLGIFYYTNRPRQPKKFRVWWVTGKYTFYALNGLTIIGVILLLTILNCLQVVFNIASGNLCETVTLTGDGSKMQQFQWGATVVFVVVIILGFVLTI